MDPSRALTFESERFDYHSDLPEESNAGNRFYGKDVAEFLACGLALRGFPSDFVDEDWGWLVFATRQAAQDFEVAIYNLSEHREGGRPGARRWGLWIRQYQPKKMLGLFTRRVEVPVAPEIYQAISACVVDAGATHEPWAVGE